MYSRDSSTGSSTTTNTAFPIPAADSLAFALIGAAQAVALVQSGNALPHALSRIFTEYADQPSARGAIQDLAYRTMRKLGRAETLLAVLTEKPVTPPILHGLLCCALTLLVEPEQNGRRPYEDFTVVNQAVSACAAGPLTARAKGMVNAVLRRFLRERTALLLSTDAVALAYWNYPAWWVDSMRASWPHDWKSILETGNQPAPLTLRVNRRRNNVADYLRQLASLGLAATQIGVDAVCLAQPLPVIQIPGFMQGQVSVQDAAAQLAAPLLDLHDGLRVLDACAAPGGKTGHLLESAQLDLLALDHQRERLARVDDNLQRLQLRANLQVGDATSRSWWDGRSFDRILADVPCTASGIVRRHPDIRWLRRKSDSAQLAALASRMLDNLWQMLAPDGKLLFVTCSIWPQESEQQAAAFAQRQHAQRLPAPGQIHPSAKAGNEHDGLYYALFQKT